MARPERTAQLLLGLILLALGLWPLIFPPLYQEPPSTLTILLDALVSGTFIALGVFVLFLGRWRGFLSRAKK